MTTPFTHRSHRLDDRTRPQAASAQAADIGRTAPLSPGMTPAARRTRLLRLMAWTVLGAAAITGMNAARAQNNLPQSAEMGRVISSIPVLQQVAIPRQVCFNEQVTVPGQKSGAGAAMGGIAGGAIGNQIGNGSGRTVATMIGLMGGAILGNNIEGNGQPQTQNVQRCTTQTVYENQTVGYNVTYEYAGRQYTVQMPQDPGQWVKLQVTPAPVQPSSYQQPYNAPMQPPQNSYPPVQMQPQSGYYPQPQSSVGVSYVNPPTVITSQTTYLTPVPVYVRPAAVYHPYYAAPVRVSPPLTQISLQWSNQRNGHDRSRDWHPNAGINRFDHDRRDDRRDDRWR